MEVRVVTNDEGEFSVPREILEEVKSIDEIQDNVELNIDSVEFTRVMHFLDVYKGQVTLLSNSKD